MVRPRLGRATAADFVHRLADHDVRMSSVGDRVRAVTHLDVDDDGIERALAACAAVVAAPADAYSRPS